jgi:hypothetical protein
MDPWMNTAIRAVKGLVDEIASSAAGDENYPTMDERDANEDASQIVRTVLAIRDRALLQDVDLGTNSIAVSVIVHGSEKDALDTASLIADTTGATVSIEGASSLAILEHEQRRAEALLSAPRRSAVHGV